MIEINYASWHWPQWTILILWTIGTINAALMHGKPRTGNHNLLWNLFGLAMAATILTAGGFFK